MDNFYTIAASELPTGACSIGIEEPTFKVRREAAKRMPSNPDSNPGFSLEQVMLAMSIKEINGNPIPANLRDPLDTIKNLMPKDVQFLLRFYVTAFTLTDELADDCKTLADNLMKQPTPTLVIPKEEMPTESFSVSFRRPSTSDEISINKRYPGAASQPGYTKEEMLMAYCITAVDGKPVDESKAVIDLLDDWDHIDAQFALGVFLNLSYMDAEDGVRATELGKKFRRKGKRSSESSTKTTKSTTKSTQKSNEPQQ